MSVPTDKNQSPVDRSMPLAGLRTLAVFHLDETTGPSRSLENELAWLATLGPLDIVCPASDAPATELRELGTVRTIDYSALMVPHGVRGAVKMTASLLRDVRAFRAQISITKPDLVISVSASLPALLVAARLERLPVLLYAGEIFDKRFASGVARSVASRMLARFTRSTATGIVACSGAVAKQFGSHPRVTTIYPPISEEFASGNGSAYRKRHGIGSEQPCVAAMGAFTEGRGQDVLLHALTEVREQFPDVRCLMAGKPYPRPQDIAYAGRLAALADQLGLTDTVVFTGFEPAPADLFAAANVFVNPVRMNEPLGRAAFEAAMGGCPVVTTGVGAIPELLRDGESALIVEPEQPAELARGIVTLLRDRNLGQRFANHAKEIARQRLAPDKCLAAFQQAVEEVVEV